MLDSSIPNSPEGEIDPGQLQWLALQLREPAAEGTVVVIHHPPVSKKVHALPMEMVRNDHELASVLSGSDVVGILSGHIHFPLTTSLAGIPVAAAAGTAHLLDPWELKGLRMVGGSGFNVVTIRDGGFEVVSMLMPGEQQEIGYYPMDLLRKHLAAAGAAVHA
jgi:3',5'-cyclic AMP phosphodiesterase CpdA